MVEIRYYPQQLRVVGCISFFVSSIKSMMFNCYTEVLSEHCLDYLQSL